MMEVFSIFIEVCAKIALILDCAIVIVFMVQLLHLVKYSGSVVKTKI